MLPYPTPCPYKSDTPPFPVPYTSDTLRAHPPAPLLLPTHRRALHRRQCARRIAARAREVPGPPSADGADGSGGEPVLLQDGAGAAAGGALAAAALRAYDEWAARGRAAAAAAATDAAVARLRAVGARSFGEMFAAGAEVLRLSPPWRIPQPYRRPVHWSACC